MSLVLDNQILLKLCILSDYIDWTLYFFISYKTKKDLIFEILIQFEK
jgi:hypothetical protein